MMTKGRKCLVFTYFSHVYSSMPLNVFVFFPVINFKRNYSLSEISTFFSVVFDFYQRMLWSALSRYSITYSSSEVDGQRTRKTFARFSRSAPKKKRAKACVLREFLLLLFNAVSLFCSALFRKTKVFCVKMLPPKHQINMYISQYQKDAKAAVRKGCRSQGPCTVARAGCMKSCSAKHATQP